MSSWTAWTNELTGRVVADGITALVDSASTLRAEVKGGAFATPVLRDACESAPTTGAEAAWGTTDAAATAGGFSTGSRPRGPLGIAACNSLEGGGVASAGMGASVAAAATDAVSIAGGGALRATGWYAAVDPGAVRRPAPNPTATRRNAKPTRNAIGGDSRRSGESAGEAAGAESTGRGSGTLGGAASITSSAEMSCTASTGSTGAAAGTAAAASTGGGGSTRDGGIADSAGNGKMGDAGDSGGRGDGGRALDCSGVKGADDVVAGRRTGGGSGGGRESIPVAAGRGATGTAGFGSGRAAAGGRGADLGGRTKALTALHTPDMDSIRPRGRNDARNLGRPRLLCRTRYPRCREKRSQLHRPEHCSTRFSSC